MQKHYTTIKHAHITITTDNIHITEGYILILNRRRQSLLQVFVIGQIEMGGAVWHRRQIVRTICNSPAHSLTHTHTLVAQETNCADNLQLACTLTHSHTHTRGTGDKLCGQFATHLHTHSLTHTHTHSLTHPPSQLLIHFCTFSEPMD